jgi:hypothetical protein
MSSTSLCFQQSKGGRTPTASRQASRHETKDASLLHSWFRLESTHRSSTCLRLITSSLVDDMTSSSEADILMYMWLVLTHKKGTCRILLHVSAAWSWLQHHDSVRCAAVFIILIVSTVLFSLRHVADIVSWLLHVLTHVGVRPNLLLPVPSGSLFPCRTSHVLVSWVCIAPSLNFFRVEHMCGVVLFLSLAATKSIVKITQPHVQCIL